MKLFAVAAIALATLGAARQDRSTQTYTATFDYYTLSLRGEVRTRERVSGTYTRNQADGTGRWSGVSVASASGDAPFRPASARPFMEGFTYQRRSGAVALTSDAFFPGFPATAVQEKSLVWDTRMFEMFGEESFDRLTPNTSYQFSAENHIDMGAAGTFTLKDARLSLTGTSMRNGQNCAVVDYQAFFNPLRLELPAMTMNGRSHFWGQIWVSLAERQIEYATLYEDVLGEVVQAQRPPVPTNVLRIGTMERIRPGVPR